ncbi:uncharacterized protein LOC108089119 [Drosophila ficusphila]|uniref:uncharacterized protein LOC108089119 n=1 Tax=Drosophila ficusphila TaxID=30025 RepID=UPI001C88F324|nr:uncharacterized protein LOC108089119 [Drosophila ficusphila]
MISVALIILCLFPCVQNEFLRPSYQVLLQRRTDLGGLTDGHCYGNILQSRLVLTAASCLLSNNSNNQAVLSGPEELAVSFKGRDLQEWIYFVDSIDVFPKFNVSSFENDIAILSLSTQLPLSERNDIEWVLVGDYDLTDLPLEVGVDSYVWKNPYGENVYPGYGVIHESNLVGIISLGLPSKNIRESNLENGITNRFLQINPYLSWIYGILQNAETADINNNSYSASLPYRQRKSAEIVNEYIEPDAGYFQGTANPSIDVIETDPEDETNIEETYTENVLVDLINEADQSNENIESETGYLTNAANIDKKNSLWILIFIIIQAKLYIY